MQPIHDSQGVFAVLEKEVRRLGFDYYAYGVRHTIPFTRPKTEVHGTYPKACLALLASASLQAQESRLDRILESGVLRVATTGDYKPFSYRTEEGGYAGFDVDMAQRLAESLGAKLVVVPTSWPNLMRDFADDRFDIAMSGISINLERQRQAYFSIPYLRDGKTPITLCSEEARFQTLEQIDQPGVTAIVNPGGTNEKFARANLKKARILVHPDNVTIFQQIVDGKADLMMTDAIEARLQSRLHPELCAVHPQQPFDFAEKAYLLPRDEAFKRYVDQWLHIAEQSGLLRQRMEHWLEYRWPTAHGK
ncbi:TPA: transporter substrate-binding domain-containing protein [Pseudomonas aeruginosa]|nr:transporter substrate-binding domain-containing protein [Pseudomonas aeruginosa]HBP0096286.1 transporter substrate-binding domain-containing protein [Pseudomonas aeruginosa]HBP0099319.1 transporter substrate-binding domain-containing protein [Pseudomonas aeruginosa]HBP0113738.1 transporter substrate-binding domain-containing protein [Pseudomonas aeruginosa]